MQLLFFKIYKWVLARAWSTVNPHREDIPSASSVDVLCIPELSSRNHQ